MLRPLPLALGVLGSLSMAIWLAASPVPHLNPPLDLPVIQGGGDPEVEPPDGGCNAGCAAIAPTSEPLGGERIIALLDQLEGAEPAATVALEELLFHGTEVKEFLSRHRALSMQSATRTALEAELVLDRCQFSLRIVDEHGVERVQLSEPVPFGIKQHLHPHDAVDLTPPEVSFTVKRVGVKHLWARL
jgi:hypothetical protein